MVPHLLRVVRIFVVAVEPASSWLAVQPRTLHTLSARRASTPLLREVDVSDLPLRPPMSPGTLVNSEEQRQEEAAVAVAVVDKEEEDLDSLSAEERTARVKAEMDAAVIGDANSKVVMEQLKSQEDNDGGLSDVLGKFLLFLDPSGIVRRRLWTRADFMHIHAVSGAYFLFLGIPWLAWSHISNAMDTSVPMETSSWFLTSLLLAGLVNALSAVPMSKFSSNKMMDMKDLKANGFTFGGTGAFGLGLERLKSQRLHLRKHRSNATA